VLVASWAGVSLSATDSNPLAGWPGLLESGVERCRRRGATDAWVTLRKQQTAQGELVSAAHEISGELRNLLEEATGLQAVTWREERRFERVARRKERGVLHLHGHYRSSESVVLGTADYANIGGNKFAQAMQQALTATTTLLLVGYGGEGRLPGRPRLHLRGRRRPGEPDLHPGPQGQHQGGQVAAQHPLPRPGHPVIQDAAFSVLGLGEEPAAAAQRLAERLPAALEGR
jgi:hypothetical protein